MAERVCGSEPPSFGTDTLQWWMRGKLEKSLSNALVSVFVRTPTDFPLSTCFPSFVDFTSSWSKQDFEAVKPRGCCKVLRSRRRCRGIVWPFFSLFCFCVSGGGVCAESDLLVQRLAPSRLWLCVFSLCLWWLSPSSEGSCNCLKYIISAALHLV